MSQPKYHVTLALNEVRDTALLISRASARLGIPVAHRLLSQGRILVDYLSLLALPLPGRLGVDQDFPVSTSLLAPWTTLPALLAIAAVAGVALVFRRRAPVAAFAAGWFFAALSLEQSVLPVDLVFEHRLYFASVGPLLAAGAAAVRFVRGPRLGAWAVVAPVVVLLAAGTWARNEDWKDPVRLYPVDGEGGPATIRNLLSAGVALMRGEIGPGGLEEYSRLHLRYLEYLDGNSGRGDWKKLSLEAALYAVSDGDEP